MALNEIQNKFPNLKDFQIYINNKSPNADKVSTLDISENNNSKINSFKFSGDKSFYTAKFYTGPFNQLVNIEFACINPYLFNFENSFPLFAKKCDYIFNSLKSFKLVMNDKSNDNVRRYLDKLDLKAIKNLIDNLDKMPNLQVLIIKSICNFDEKEYMILIEKLLSSNIKNIEFVTRQEEFCEYYSKNELQNIYKNIDIEKFKKIKISKYN